MDGIVRITIDAFLIARIIYIAVNQFHNATISTESRCF